MRVDIDCFPCFLRQSIIALRLGTEDKALQEFILKSTLEVIRNTDVSKTPAHITTLIHRKIRKMLNKDPFKEIKSEYNRIALRMYPLLRNMIENSPDPLWTSTRLSVAGNVIDFGIFTSVDIEGTIRQAMNNAFAVDDYAVFKDALSQTDDVFYLTDNAGEIVFDRLLIETLIHLGKRVTAVVKGSPVINDAVLEDAEESGLTEVCEVIDNGSEAVGTILDWTSPLFQEAFENAPFIISKGQGNFETLIGAEKTIFFLFQSKCDVVSKELGLPTGSMLLRKS
jgi:uncharacterized protein with ATP-grasp and redox domains